MFLSGLECIPAVNIGERMLINICQADDILLKGNLERELKGRGCRGKQEDGTNY